MKDRLVLLSICLLAVVLLAGCKGDSDSGSFFSFGGSSGDNNIGISGLPGDGSGGTSPGSSGTGGDNGNPGGFGHTPEPTTMGLIGGGLLAYALYRRKRKK